MMKREFKSSKRLLFEMVEKINHVKPLLKEEYSVVYQYRDKPLDIWDTANTEEEARASKDEAIQSFGPHNGKFLKIWIEKDGQKIENPETPDTLKLKYPEREKFFAKVKRDMFLDRFGQGDNVLNNLNEDEKWIQKAVDPAHKGYCTPMTKPTCTPQRKALAKRFKKGIDEATERGSEIIYTFRTDAITEIQDSSNGKQYRHPVYLIKGNPKYAPTYNGVVLSISDTPGAWYVDTLMEGNTRYSNIIYIDFGQKWICSNWSEIMKELNEWISNNSTDEPVAEGINFNAMFPVDVYKKKADEIKALIDSLLQDEDDEALDTLHRLLVRRTAPVKQASPEELQEIFDKLKNKFGRNE